MPRVPCTQGLAEAPSVPRPRAVHAEPAAADTLLPLPAAAATGPGLCFIFKLQGTEKSEGSLNIFLEYVPGGSIASLLAKFG